MMHIFREFHNVSLVKNLSRDAQDVKQDVLQCFIGRTFISLCIASVVNINFDIETHYLTSTYFILGDIHYY